MLRRWLGCRSSLTQPAIDELELNTDDSGAIPVPCDDDEDSCALASTTEDTNSQLASSREHVSQLESKIVEEQVSVERLSQQLSEELRERKQMEVEHSQLKASAEKITKQLADSQHHMAKLEHRAADQDAKVRQLQGEIQAAKEPRRGEVTLMQQVEAMRQEKAESEARQKEAVDEVTVLKEQVGELGGKVQQLQNELEGAKEAAERREADGEAVLMEQLQAMRKEKAESEAREKGAINEVTVLKVEVRQLEGKVQQLEKAVERHRHHEKLRADAQMAPPVEPLPTPQNNDPPSEVSSPGVVLDPVDTAFEARWEGVHHIAGKWQRDGVVRRRSGSSISMGPAYSPTADGSTPRSRSLAPSQPLCVPVQRYDGHSESIAALCTSPEQLFTCSQDNTARAFDLQTGEVLLSFEAHVAPISAMCLSELDEDAQCSLFTASHDGTVCEWDTATGELLQEFGSRSPRSMDSLNAVCLDNMMLYAGGRNRDRLLVRYNLATGAMENIPSGHSCAVTSLCCFRRRVFSAGMKGELREWLVDEDRVGVSYEGHQNEITCLAAHVDSLYSGSRDATIKHWSLQTGAMLHVLTGHLSAVTSISVLESRDSESGTDLVSSSSDATMRLWHTETGECRGILSHQESAVTAVAWAPAGRLLAGCATGTACLFDLQHQHA